MILYSYAVSKSVTFWKVLEHVNKSVKQEIWFIIQSKSAQWHMSFALVSWSCGSVSVPATGFCVWEINASEMTFLPLL